MLSQGLVLIVKKSVLKVVYGIPTVTLVRTPYVTSVLTGRLVILVLQMDRLVLMELVSVEIRTIMMLKLTNVKSVMRHVIYVMVPEYTIVQPALMDYISSQIPLIVRQLVQQVGRHRQIDFVSTILTCQPVVALCSLV